jgi:hypothetical protein
MGPLGLRAELSKADHKLFDELCIKSVSSDPVTTAEIHDFVYAEIKKLRNQKLIVFSRTAKFKEYIGHSLRRGVARGHIQKLLMAGKKVALWKAVVADAPGV